MNFNDTIKKLKLNHTIVLIALGIALFIVWIMKNSGNFQNSFINNSQLVIILEYIGILATGLVIWYGYHNYEKVLKESKDNDDESMKQANFLKTKRLQNSLIYVSIILNIVLFIITSQKQFAMLGCIALIFCAINFPTQGKYERDYCEALEDENPEEEVSERENSEKAKDK